MPSSRRPTRRRAGSPRTWRATKPPSRSTKWTCRASSRSSLTFVLVHGAGGGSWMWQRLAPLLRKAGHDVYTPSLTGIGERAHLASPAVGVSTHIADVLGTLEYERLEGVVLVGHSYAGMVVTGVADREPERLSALVYLDAFVPQAGQA